MRSTAETTAGAAANVATATKATTTESSATAVGDCPPGLSQGDRRDADQAK
jgi:hypothetical protein